MRRRRSKILPDCVNGIRCLALISPWPAQMESADNIVRILPEPVFARIDNIHDSFVCASRDEQYFPILLNHQILFVREIIGNELVAMFHQQRRVTERAEALRLHARKNFNVLIDHSLIAAKNEPIVWQQRLVKTDGRYSLEPPRIVRFEGLLVDIDFCV